MSSQAIRNKLNTSIRRVITEVKKKALSEGKKKIIELSNELLTPEQIIKILSADINKDSCSIKGREKMKEKVEELNSLLNQTEEIAQTGLDVMVGLESKIGGISSKIEIPNAPNPIKGITDITTAIEPILLILEAVILVSPSILAANISAPGTGGPVNGLAIAQTNNKVNFAKAKIAEYTNLFKSLPIVLNSYISMADKVFDNVTKIKNQIERIIGEISKLRAFILFMELDFESKCNTLQLGSPNPIPDPPTPSPEYPLPLTLPQVIKNAEELYGKLLESLIAQGDHKAIRRVYKLGVQLQRTINTKVEVIDI